MALDPNRSQETKDRIRELVDAALQRKGMSARQASMAVVGHDGLVRDIRAGRMPSLDKLEALFELLGLELYFGPKRDLGPVAQFSLDETEFAHVPLYDAALAAGGGAINSTDVVVDTLAFKSAWLKQMGVAPSRAVLARIARGETGESMSPTIEPGDLVLIDTSRKEIPVRERNYKSKKPPIYAFASEDGARVKRLSQMGEFVILVSDNPTFPPEFVSRTDWKRVNVIGRVVWWGHTVRD